MVLGRSRTPLEAQHQGPILAANNMGHARITPYHRNSHRPSSFIEEGLGAVIFQNKMFSVIVIAAVVALSGGIMTFAIIPSSPCAGVLGVTHNFTIIANLHGFNDSADHQGSWPVMIVNRCDMVKITIINNDTQAHGFAIDNYAARGVEVEPQQPFTFQFLASTTGSFRVYCNVFCTVHYSMQNGLLNVE